MIEYLVTTNKDLLPSGPIAMIDGTVPHWQPRANDFHFDHHRPGGDLVQLTEIPDNCRIPDDTTIVTTQVDADACAAAAWLQILKMQLDSAQEYEVQQNLIAIAYDCDHLGLPAEPKWDPWRDFAKNAVAALKENGNQVIKKLGLDPDRSKWDEPDKVEFASHCFREGTEALISAALGNAAWPGQNGEADAYWARVETMRPYVDLCSKLIDNCAVLDQRSLNKYCDPRLLVEWARSQPGHSNVTLTVRDRLLVLLHTEEELTLLPKEWQDSDNSEYAYKIEIPACSYTLGSVPLHPYGSPKFSDRNVWQKLANAERAKRLQYGYPMPSSDWGGRNEVGGSSWNDACILTPEEVIKIARG